MNQDQMKLEKALHLLIDKIFNKSGPKFMLDLSERFYKTYLNKVAITPSQMNRVRDIFNLSSNYSSLIDNLKGFINHQKDKDKEGKHWASVPEEEKANGKAFGDIFLDQVKNINQGFLDPIGSKTEGDLVSLLKSIVNLTQPKDTFDQLIKKEPQRQRIKFKLARCFFFTLLKYYRSYKIYEEG